MRNSVKSPKKITREIISPTKDTFGLSAGLIGDLQLLIESTRIRVAVGVNVGMVLLYWDIGERIRTEILSDERAAYGKQVIDILSEQLSAQYGRGFARTNLFNMIRFAELDSFQEYHLY